MPDECAETLVRTLVDHFVAIGGIPLLAVFDRPKTVALKWTRDGQVTEWNPLFAGVALDLGLGIEVCWPAGPQQNGKVERSHRIDDEEFWQRHAFASFDDAAVALEAWERRDNHERFSMALRGHTPSEALAANSALKETINLRQSGPDLEEVQQSRTPCESRDLGRTIAA